MNGKNILHQLKTCSGVQMMSYVIETADNKIIVIDGGFKKDSDYLADFIRNLTGGALRVDAWILTHAHNDHIDAFVGIAEKYGNELELGGLYYNFPPFSFIEQYNSAVDTESVRQMEAILPLFADRIHTVHTGDRLDIGAFHCDFLFEPDVSITGNAINNSSIVFRITLGSKTILILGDLGVEGGRVLLERYGSSLKSDMVEMAHHGQNGVERDVYEAVAPSVCLWATPRWLWENDAGKGYNTHNWQTIIVRGWMEELGVKEHYIEMNGTDSIPCD